MKKIAIVSSLNGIGGTEKSLLSFLESIPQDKYIIELLLLGESGPLLGDVPEWIAVRFIKYISVKDYLIHSLRVFRFDRLLSAIHNYLCIRRQIKKYKVDTMYQYQKTMLFFERVNDEYDIAVSWFVPNSFHTVFTLENIKADRKVLWIHMDVQKDPIPFDANKFFQRYDKIFCVSKACKMSFDTKYPECTNKTDVFYNTMNLKAIREAGKILPSDMSIDPNVFKLVTCGRITYEKQPLLSIKVVKELIHNGYNNIMWYFIGDGAMKDDFQKQINDSLLNNYIKILGSKMNPYAYMAHANLYVQMSLHESYCLTLAEAQLLGVPAITTDFPSAYEIVNNEVTGLIVQNNWRSLYEGICQLCDNRKQITIMKNNLKDHSLQTNGDIRQFIKYIDCI